MKPLNLDNKPCSPTSSNCIIWQGPDIPCIDLCTGDTISDVVFKLATELCTILDQTNVNNYDLACLGITACKPKDFQALIQLLIDKICEIQGITPEDIKTNPGCPDCIVSVAPCFQVGNVTTMQLLDYVQMIGEKICALIDEIGNINAQITDIIIRLEELENAPPPVFTIPSFTLGCDIGSLLNGSTQFINVVLEEFINNVWCPFYEVLGTTGDLVNAVDAICITDADLQLTTGTPFSTNPNWIQSGDYNTIADAINNLWVAVCDIYNASPTFAVTDTNTVNLTVTGGVIQADVQDTGWVDLLGFDFYSTDPTMTIPRPQCRRIGNVVHFRGQVTIPLEVSGSPGLVRTYLYGGGQDTYLGGTAPNNVITPYQGNGGVRLDSSGFIEFNSNGITAQSVIPTSVIPGGYVLDGRYQNDGWKLAYRVVDTGSNTTILTTFFSPVITENGVLTFGLIKNAEEGIVGGGGSGAWDTCPINNVISHVLSGYAVPKYDNGLPAAATNVLHDGGGATGMQTRQVYYSTTEEYPFSCNANDENDVGGFHLRIDGLTAFISPCADLIPTPTPCE
jgi:hypothetical protein